MAHRTLLLCSLLLTPAAHAAPGNRLLGEAVAGTFAAGWKTDGDGKD